jgi:hypothetical protein
VLCCGTIKSAALFLCLYYQCLLHYNYAVAGQPG